MRAFSAFVRDSYAAVEGNAVEDLPTFRDAVRSQAVRDAVLDSISSRTWRDVAI